MLQGVSPGNEGGNHAGNAVTYHQQGWGGVERARTGKHLLDSSGSRRSRRHDGESHGRCNGAMTASLMAGVARRGACPATESRDVLDAC
jgi:hypothetical protein